MAKKKTFRDIWDGVTVSNDEVLSRDYTPNAEQRAAHTQGYGHSFDAEESLARKAYEEHLAQLEQGGQRRLSNQGVDTNSPMNQYSYEMDNNPELNGMLTAYNNAKDHVANLDGSESNNKSQIGNEIMRRYGYDQDTLDSMATLSRQYNAIQNSTENQLNKSQQIVNDANKQYDINGNDLQEAEKTAGQSKMQWLTNMLANIDPSGGASMATSQSAYDYSVASEEAKAEEDKIKSSGMSSEDSEKYIAAQKRLANKSNYDDMQKQMQIDPNESKVQKAFDTIGLNLNSLAMGYANALDFGAAVNAQRTKTDVNGMGYDVYDPSNISANAREIANQETLEQIGEDNKVGTFLYNAGYSTADSAVRTAPAMALGAGGAAMGGITKGMEAIGLIGFGSSAYNSALKEAKANGYTDEDAKKYALSMGVIEAVTELIPLDNAVTNIGGRNAEKSFIATFFKQAFTEGAEEAIGDVLGAAADAWIAADNPNEMSEYERSVQSYIQGGMSEKEAKTQAVKDFAMQTVEDFLSGTVSGGISSGVSLGLGAANTSANVRQTQKNISTDSENKAKSMTGDTDYEKSTREMYESYKNNPTQYVVDQIDDTTEKGKELKDKAQKIADKEAEGKKLSAIDRINLAKITDEASEVMSDDAVSQGIIDDMKAQNEANLVPNEFRTARTNITRNEYENKLTEAINNEDVEAFGKVVQQAKNSTSADLRNNAEEIANQAIYEGRLKSKGFTQEQIDSAKASTQDAYMAGLKGEDASDNMSIEVQKAYNAGKEQAIKNKGKYTVENKTDIKDVKATDKDGNIITLSGQFKDGKMVTTDGKLVDLDTVSLDDNAISQVLRMASYRPTDAEANAYLNNIEDGTNIQSYNRDFLKFYKAGQANLDLESEIKSGLSMVSEETARSIYQAGFNDLVNDTRKAAMQTVHDALGITKGTGAFTDSRKKAKNDDTAKISNLVSKALGVDVVLVDDIKNDTTAKINASFNATTSTITVSAGAAQQLFHEVGEFVQFYNAEGHESLRKGLNKAAMDVMGSEKYAQWHDTYMTKYKEAGDIQTSREITNEMTNDLLVSLMATEEGRNAMAKYLAENSGEEAARTFGQKVANLFTSIANSIRSFVKSDRGMQGEMLLKGAKDLEKYADEFIKALDVAIQNYNNESYVPSIDEKEYIHSVDTSVEAVGLTFQKDGQLTVLLDENGNRINHVTIDMVVNSPWGAVINSAVNNGFISESDSKKQAQFVADLLNQMLKMQDIDLVWAVNSTIGFQQLEPGERTKYNTNDIVSKNAGYTKNSDPQYSTTVDFTTICLKTQAVIDAMSETMKRLNRGLTEDEIVNIVYKNTHEAGEPVPCPVCYVFSRWVGLGGLFDKMNNLQNTYPIGTDLSEIRKAKAEADKKIKAIQDKTGDNKSKAKDKLYKEVQARYDMLKAFEKWGKITAEEKKELEIITKEKDLLEDYAWFEKVRLKKNYTPVPTDILFDINAGKEFADKYPDSWKYRTTRGPSMGKAATPYADEHIGQIIRGIGSPSQMGTLGDLTKDPFLYENVNGELKQIRDGKLRTTAKSLLTNAINKQKAQNLLNGTRLQSTSDYRFEYGLDYLMTFFELQAVGAKVQLYTKVPESVIMHATVNGEVNCSLMPQGMGYVADKDGNPILDNDGKIQLVFSSITGMHPDDAFMLSSMFDNVQPIVVGTNNTQIRACMEDERITFIIPYHASGANEGRYVDMMKTVGESVPMRTDYSAYQTDNKNPDASPIQKKTRELRKAIVTGKASTLNNEQKKILENNEVLHELYKRFYGKDLNGKKAKVNDKYLDSADKGTGVDHNTLGVFLKKSQSDIIMPYEYWDKTLTIDEADQNSINFANYLESMGMYPRFSGYNSNGIYNAEFDLLHRDGAIQQGYWKTLPDRSMYNLDGTYHEQKPIDVTEYRMEFLDRSESVKKVVKPSQVNDKTKIPGIVEKSIADINSKYSVDIDSDGKALTTEQQEYFKDSKVRDEDGRLKVMYHGSRKAGFNVFDISKTLEGFFFSDMRTIGEGYADSENVANQDSPSYVDNSNGVYEVYLNITNPYVIDAEAGFWENFRDYSYDPSKETLYGSVVVESVGDKYNVTYREVIDPEDAEYWSDAITETLTASEVENKFGEMVLKKSIGTPKIAYNYVLIDNEKGWVPNSTGDVAWYAKEHGYDGAIIKNVTDPAGDSDVWDESTVAVAFDSNQIKSIYNENPTTSDDIRYSLAVDNIGNALTDNQQKYFKESKIVDELGRLKVMYHGTPNVGFTVFNALKSDDGISLFFSDSRDVASSYSGLDDIYSPDEKVGYDELVERFDGASGGDIALSRSGDKYVITEYDFPHDKETVVASLEEANKWLSDWINLTQESNETAPGIYPVYLNITNPLVIEADGEAWNQLSTAFIRDVDGVKLGAEYEYAYLYNQIGDDQWEIEYSEFGDLKTEVFTREELEKKFGADNALMLINGDEVDDIAFDTNGNSIPTNTRGIAEYAHKHGYDGVIISNVRDVGVYGLADKSLDGISNIAIAFDSNQVKSINNKNPTTAEDIRHSIGIDDFWDSEYMMTDTIETREAAQVLKEGMEALKHTEVDTEAVSRLAYKIKKDTKSSVNVKKLTEDLTKVFAYMQNEDYVDYSDMMGILNEVAKPIIDASETKVGTEAYKEFVNKVKGYSIKLTDTQKKEVISAFGSYGRYRSQMMPLNISDKGEVTLEAVWQEIVEASGYALDYDSTEGAQPLELYDTLMAMRPTTENIYGEDAEQAAQDLAMRIVEDYFIEVGKTEAKSKADQKSKDAIKKAADRMREKNSEYRKKVKADYEERLKQARKEMRYNVRWRDAEHNAKIEEIKAKNKAKAADARERRLVKEEKKKIQKRASELYNWVTKQTEAHHVPTDMVAPVVQFLNAMDFVEPKPVQNKDGLYTIKIYTGKYEDAQGKTHPDFKTLTGATEYQVLHKYYNELANGNGSRSQLTWQEKMRGIQEIFDKVQKGEQFDNTDMDSFLQTIDPTMADMFDDMLSRNGGVANINRLGSADIKIINNALRNVMHAITQANKAYSIRADITDLAKNMISKADSIETKQHGKFYNNLVKFGRIDNLNPKVFMTLLGDPGKKLYKGLRDGLNTKIKDVRKAGKYMADVMIGLGITQKDLAEWSGTEANVYDFDVAEGTLRMTAAQMMSLYETMKRNGGIERMSGGIIADTIDRGKFSKPIAQEKAIHLTLADMINITDHLTDKQKAYADAMQYYLANDCSKDGNEVSNKLYGYEKFLDETYFPYTVDKDTVASTDENLNTIKLNGIERSGFTKQLKEGAVNPLMIRDILDVFTDHVADMAAYHGYAAANKDVLRWLNYREISDADENGFRTNVTTKKAINKICQSTSGVGYLNKMLQDINGSEKSQYIGNFTEALMGNYKAAAVGANLSVIAQQPTAYFRAAYMVSPKYLLGVNPLKAIKNVDRVNELSAIAWWKSQGYYETSIGKSMKEMITGQQSKADKIKDAMMAPAGKADDLTWAVLYTAIEKEQKAKSRGENLTEEEFRQRVNDRFDEVVDSTQVVDSTLHRSQYMRSKDRLNVIQTAFMAEPTKSYNMLVEAALSELEDGDSRGKILTRATAAYVLSNTAAAAAKAVVDAFRYDTDDDDWGDVWIEKFLSNLKDNINPFNLLPVVKDLSSLFFNLINGESVYSNSSSRLDTEVFNTLISTAKADILYATGESNKTPYGIIMANARLISQVTGMPIYNAARDLTSIYNAFFDDITTTVKTEKTFKQGVTKSIGRDESIEDITTEVTEAVENNTSIYDIENFIKSTYKEDYVTAVETYGEDSTEAKTIAEMANKGFVAGGRSEDEADELINGWLEETVSYGALDKAIKAGDIDTIIAEATLLKDEKEVTDIQKHIYNRFGSTVEFERNHDVDSNWEDNVNEALAVIDPNSDYDSVKKVIQEKAKESEEKKALEAENNARKKAVVDALDSGDYTAYINALSDLEKNSKEETAEKKKIDARDKAKGGIKSAYKSQIEDAMLKGDDATVKELQKKAATYMSKLDEKYGLGSYDPSEYYAHELEIVQNWTKE